MAKYAFGIDLGGTTVKCGFFSSEGELLECWEIPTRSEDNGKNVLPDIAEAIRGKMEEKKAKKSDIIGVGIGVPGPVLDSGIVNSCVNLGWGVIDVKEELSEMLDGVPVCVGNDANVAALGEMWKGGGKGFDSIVMVTLGTGVGGGVIINGKIVAGSHGAGGEIGHITVDPTEEEYCNCGKKGCLEQYCSATGITRMARKALTKSKKTILTADENLSAKSVFDAAKAGDQVALDLVDAMGAKLGMTLAWVASTVDPEAFVIGGGVSKAGSIVTEAIAKHYMPNTFHACRSTVFKLAELGNEAGMYGAVKMVLQ